MSSETPFFPVAVQDRQKRRRIELDQSPSQGEFDRAADQMIKDESLPLHIRTILAYLLEGRKHLESMIERNRELAKQTEDLLGEISSLRAENENLKKSIELDASTPTRVDHVNACRSYEDIERSRSLVLVGVPESRDSQSSNRISHDFTCERQIMDYLSIDCHPLSAYRMGRPSPTHSRLLKIVLPSSFFARTMLRRAYQLKYFPLKKGIFIRPSLPKERARIRAEREARLSMQKPNTTMNRTTSRNQNDAVQHGVNPHASNASSIRSDNGLNL
ncbi:hypothetical protein Aduo_014964 [Ancylostoma duodenale]